MVRGSLPVVVTPIFNWLQSSTGNYLTAGWVTGAIVLTIGIFSVVLSEETYHKDLDYIEGATA
jgi:hypothetical protein